MSGIPLAMRAVQVTNAVCAFAFRNDSGRTLQMARIHYYHGGRTDNDILPGLRPGQVLGGWAAFSVEDRCSNVSVQVYDASWR
ncbi:MAG TPA: hypothetical protein VFN42_11145 [Acetobacteraceae bacterium]|nr:hypothetical protein [Acetobacteraceae bacterium]